MEHKLRPQLCQLSTEARLGFSVGVLREVSITPSISTPDVGQLSRLLYSRRKGAASSVGDSFVFQWDELPSSCVSLSMIVTTVEAKMNSSRVAVAMKVLGLKHNKV